jgi:putative SOS response-associated peptidase YedK
MCGRFVIAADANALQQAFNLENVPEFSPRYNIAPTQNAPVITNEHPKELSFYRWGLIPSWSKDISVGQKMINAREEGIEDKPSFRAAFRRRRCLVPATGFYEWQKQDDGKVPHYIHLTDQPIFALAGLWEVWRDAEKKEIRTFTILTTEANPFMQTLHNRMPVILRREDYDLWLTEDEVPADVLRPLLRQYDPNAMAAYEVSKSVNRPVVDTPELIQPVA